MKGGKAGKGSSGRKKPVARAADSDRVRTGPKRGEKPREWGAFDTSSGVPQAAPPKGKISRKP